MRSINGKSVVALAAFLVILSFPVFARTQFDRLSLFLWYQRPNGEIYFQEQYGRLEKHFVSQRYWSLLKHKPELLAVPN